ncbi:MAG: class I SAM-dependent methyltransferase [Actinomycetota bacterium]
MFGIQTARAHNHVMPGRWAYNLLYRRGAPWEIGPRSELVSLVESGRLNTSSMPRAIDLGCGTGANSVYLAEHGFDVTGIDFSPVAVRKARARAAERGVTVNFVQGDLTTFPIPGVSGPFDLLVDYGTLDDLKGARRDAMAATFTRLAGSGSTFLLWCFCAEKSELPIISFNGPSKLSGALSEGEIARLFQADFDIERLPEPRPESLNGCFLLTKRGRSPGV